MVELHTPAGPLGEPIVIRFDGLDADNHVIELSVLAESLRGLSRIIASSGHFALTQRIATRRDKQIVRVVVRPPRGGCVVIDAIVQYAHHHPLFTDYATNTLAAVTATVIAYIFARGANKREEMKMLSAALEKAIGELGSRDQPTIARLLDTVDRMADTLAPAVKQAVAPVGVSARTLTVGIASTPDSTVVIDEPAKTAIFSEATLRVGEEKAYDVLIGELDMISGACHVHLADEPESDRHAAKITDPAFGLPNNPYVLSMAAVERLRVRAKATLREGEIDRLYISDCEGKKPADLDDWLRPAS
jgi:hypothetical protein